MTLINSNIPERDNHKNTNNYKFKNNGLGVRSNIKWTYNFKPFLNIILVLLGLIIFLTVIIKIKNNYMEKIQEKEIAENSEKIRKEFLMRKLETLKKETMEKDFARRLFR